MSTYTNRMVAYKQQMEIAEEFAKARLRDGHPHAFIGEAEFYCENPACNLREVTIHLKEYDGPTTATFICPACRKRLKLHWVRALSEMQDA